MKAVQRLLLAVITLVFLTGVAFADGCPNVRILNESNTTKLNEETICNAAQQWVNKGFQVYIFVTDANPGTEDEWFLIRDRVEGAWGIYNPSNDTFSKGALAVELTTVTGHPWGQDLAFGEYLFSTPLDNDAVIGRLEGQLKNTVTTGEVSGAIVEILNQSYQIAYPPVTPTPKPMPTVIVTGPTTIHETKVDFGPLVRLIAIFAAAVAILAGIVFFVIPALTKAGKIAKMRNHLLDLAKRVDSLLLAADSLFAGDKVEDTILWQLFSAYGGEAYPELVTQVRGLIERSRKAIEEAFLLNQDLDQRLPNEKPGAYQEMIKAYEMVAVTITGTDLTILGLDDEALRKFVDPMAPGVESQMAGSHLVEQVAKLRSELSARPLKVQFMVVNPEKVDAQGVFGYANGVKSIIRQLADAREQGPKQLAEAKSARQKAAADQWPEGLTPDLAFSAADTLITQADGEAGKGRFLEVEKLSQRAIGLITKIIKILPEVTEAVSRYSQVLAATKMITDQGYRLGFFLETSDNCQKIRATMYNRISQGDPEGAQRSIQNLKDESANLLTKAQQLVDLRGKNEGALRRLSAETARVDHFRLTKALPAWQELKGYPVGNWKLVERNFGIATRILAEMFDYPADPNDPTSSSIANLNSMKIQDFAGAELKLVDAFALLRQAEQQLMEVITQLEKIQLLEASLQGGMQTVAADIRKATARRDQENTKIDKDVDTMISEAAERLARAQAEFERREFTGAESELAQAKKLATNAYASADQQAAEINGLMGKLVTAGNRAQTKVYHAQTNQADLTPAAQNALTAGKILYAADALKKGKTAESRVAGKEDRALSAALREAVTYYTEAERLADEALRYIEEDKAGYDRVISRTRNAIDRAKAAISQAGEYVEDDDASGAGSTSLRQAQNELPSLPDYGAISDAFDRAERSATRAKTLADQAAEQAQEQIREVERAREARRAAERAAAEAARQAALAEQRRQEAAHEAASSSSRSSSWSSSSRSSSWSPSSSSRRSSFGSSSGSRPSSMGSSRRR